MCIEINTYVLMWSWFKWMWILMGNFKEISLFWWTSWNYPSDPHWLWGLLKWKTFINEPTNLCNSSESIILKWGPCFVELNPQKPIGSLGWEPGYWVEPVLDVGWETWNDFPGLCCGLRTHSFLFPKPHSLSLLNGKDGICLLGPCMH